MAPLQSLHASLDVFGRYVLQERCVQEQCVASTRSEGVGAQRTDCLRTALAPPAKLYGALLKLTNGRQLRAARVLLGWNQAKLAKAARVAIGTIRRMESFEAAIKFTDRHALWRAAGPGAWRNRVPQR
jgi:hypothetical protein